jgi:hypothetical protein
MEQQSFPKDVRYITDRITIDVATRQEFPTADARGGQRECHHTIATHLQLLVLREVYLLKFVSSVQMFMRSLHEPQK